MANTHIRFKESESEYSASNSDDDYTEKERNLLHKIKNRKTDDSDSDDEVYGIGSEEDEESSEHRSDIALSDVEGQDGDDLPDIRAWGKDKRKFYSTDYVDPDYSGFQGKNATLAELEEEEAKNLQKQLIQELDDEDFSLEMFIKHKEPENKDELEEVVKTDVSKLSKRQKLQLVKQESPEFFELINDFKVKIAIAKEVLKPTLELTNKNKIMECEAVEFVKFYYQLILNYTTNISMYLLLKASKVNLKNHPIVKRLFQYRQHLSQMDKVFEDVIKPQIEILISLSEKDTLHEPEKKTLKLLGIIQSKKQYNPTTVKERPFATNEIKANSNGNKETRKQVKFAINKPESDTDSSDSEDLQNAETENIGEDNADDQIIGEKRAITYQIAKNKGLTPHRKKEQRNPRVKHRNKFRKAKIRRKGAVRDVRKELS
ncbi:hypothetical protein AMK59_8071, partial [Oryctes borbonicus]